MKARRSMQILVGIWTLLLALGLVLVTAAAFTADILPDQPAILKNFAMTLKEGLQKIADTLQIGDVYYVIPLVVYVYPFILLMIGAILLLKRNKSVEGKNIAGCVFALLGGIPAAGFSAILCKPLAGDDLFIFAGAFGGWLLLLILFVSLALGLHRKEVALQPMSQRNMSGYWCVDDTVDEEPTTPTEEAPQSTDQPQEVPYVPQDNVTVQNTADEVYDQPKEQPAAMTKIEKLHMLLEVGAITEAEYLKLLQSYLK